MKKVKSYLKNIQNNEEYQKDIEFLEKKSNGREDKKFSSLCIYYEVAFEPIRPIRPALPCSRK